MESSEQNDGAIVLQTKGQLAEFISMSIHLLDASTLFSNICAETRNNLEEEKSKRLAEQSESIQSTEQFE